MREGIGKHPSYKGLSLREVERSRIQYGRNEIVPPRRKSLFFKIVSGFSDPIIRVLIGALLLNFLFLFKNFNLFETLGILAAILLAAVISALSERGGELAFEKLMRETSGGMCFVRRGGKTVRIPTAELVVGDAVLLEAGQKIPADGVLVRGEVTLDQSALNGESTEVVKKPVLSVPEKPEPSTPGVLLRGAVVLSGEGVLYVTAVGQGSLFGQMSREMTTELHKTPLKRRLEKLASQMSTVGYIAAGIVLVSYLVNVFLVDTGWDFSAALALCRTPSVLLPALIRGLMLGTSVIVMAVPEGLPMMISVVLSSNVRRMKRDRVLVRRSVGIETAGSLNLLFCDKTGTLTRGRARVEGVIPAFCDQPIPIRQLRRYPAFYLCYERSARYNTQSRSVSGRACGGNMTDRAILSSVLPLTERTEETVCEKTPFDSVRKCSSCRVGDTVYCKGAPEYVLDGVTYSLDADGTARPYFDRERVFALQRQYADEGGRVLALTVAQGGVKAFHSLILLRDPLRPEAKESVAALQKAGVGVVMVTGDNAGTARAIAVGAGLLTKERDTVLSGAELGAMSDERVIGLLPRLAVVARALPQDKSRLVRLAQSAGLTVGMTGDGINDTPALRAADVGFAMGSGTDVAKEAGDIVILDDNIRSICRAVLYGRTIFKSIRKFVLFQMTTNLLAVAVTVICPLIGIDAPITVLQLLWLNMIMDTFGSLAFAGEAPLAEYMEEPPKRRDEPILNGYMIARVILLGGYMLGLCLWFLSSDGVALRFGALRDPARLQCAFFALFIFADLANCFGARSVSIDPFRGLRENKSFIFIFLFIILVQLCLLYFGGQVFRTVPLSLQELLPVILLSLTVLPVNMLIKWILRRVFRQNGI